MVGTDKHGMDWVQHKTQWRHNYAKFGRKVVGQLNVTHTKYPRRTVSINCDVYLKESSNFVGNKTFQSYRLDLCFWIQSVSRSELFNIKYLSHKWTLSRATCRNLSRRDDIGGFRQEFWTSSLGHICSGFLHQIFDMTVMKMLFSLVKCHNQLYKTDGESTHHKLSDLCN
jgi:hypothetical protein